MFKRYISSNLHVALALWAFCYVIALPHGLRFSFYLQLAVFGFGWAAYQYLHVFVPSFYKKQRPGIWSILSFISALSIGVFGLINLPKSDWIVFFGVGVLTFCYALPFGAKMGLRFVPTIKIFIVAVCWTALAMLSLKELPSDIFVLVAVKSLLWIICLILPFELRDMHKDAPALKTFPQLLGTNGVFGLGLFLSLLIAFIAFKTVQVDVLLWVEWLMSILIIISIKIAPKRTNVFTAFWVEGIPILWLLLSVLSLSLY